MRTALIAMAAAVLVSSSTAEAVDRFVSTKGDDGGGANACTDSTAPCRTIVNALVHASSGDVIKVAKGAYTGSVEIVTGGTWTILGGYGKDFDDASRNAVKNKTKVSGDKNNRFLRIHAESGEDIAVVLDGLIVQKSKGGGDGGGILARAEEGGSIDLDLDEMTFIGNQGSLGGALALSTEAGSITATITAPYSPVPARGSSSPSRPRGSRGTGRKVVAPFSSGPPTTR